MTNEQYIKQQLVQFTELDLNVVCVYLNPEDWQVLADELAARAIYPTVETTSKQPTINMVTVAGSIRILPMGRKLARPSFVFE